MVFDLRLFLLVRRALDALKPPSREDIARRAAEDPAVALYCLAATRLVDQAIAERCAAYGSKFVLDIPRSEHVVYAVIATAIFGGELHLRIAKPRGLRQPE